MTKVCFIGAGSDQKIGVGFKISSKHSLLDYDVAIFVPSHFDNVDQHVEDVATFNVSRANRVAKYIEHWNEQFLEFLRHGKTVIFLINGEVPYNLSNGRNYERVTNYSPFPIDYKIVPRDGKEIAPCRHEKANALFAHIKPVIQYRGVVTGSVDKKLIESKSGGLALCAVDERLGGRVVLAPMLDLDRLNIPVEDVKAASEKRASYLRHYYRLLVELGVNWGCADDAEPEPEWADGVQFKSTTEGELHTRIAAHEAEKNEAIERIARLEAELVAYDQFRVLLYGSGKSLEAAVISALKLLGFTAQEYVDGESQYDVVFHSAEGIFVGEVEGKRSGAIDVTKIRQLNDNVLEYYDKVGGSLPTPVMFGNPFRSDAPALREGDFTPKATSVAARVGAALVRTSDLYDAVLRVLNGADEEFKSASRQAILSGAGGIVRFPELS